MNVLSLFNGMGCIWIALDRLGIKVDKRYVSETDRYANIVNDANYRDTIHLGDVTKVTTKGLAPIDLIVGGSPCQGFSFAGKQLNFEDPRSKLFFEFVRIMNENPDALFLLENVKMKKEYQDVISRYLGVEPIEINSSRVSAQNRKRLYWTNIPGISQPEDREIYLSDIIESGLVDRDKSYCIDANYWKGTTIEQYIKKARRQVVFEAAAFTERRTEEAKKIRREYREKYGRDFSPRRGKEMVLREDGKMNCLTGTYSLKEHTLLDEKINYRKLTPIECERLQTVPDNYTNFVSNAQRYKMLGNGWTVDVIAHILKNIDLI
jgi:site-specific DNA-cytosine methylase